MFERIAFLKLCCAGDILFTTPAIRAVKRAFPGSKLFYISGPYSRFISEHNPHVEATFIVPPPFEMKGNFASANSFLKGIGAIKKGKFDLVVSFHRSKAVAAMARIGSSGKILGFSTARPFVHYSAEFDPLNHEVQRYLDLVSIIGARADGLEMEYMTTQDEDEQASEILHHYNISGAFAAVAPGGGVNPGSTMYIKRWPISRYKEITKSLRQKHDLKVVAIGSSSERQLVDEIGPDANLAGKTTFAQLAAVLKKAKIMIGNDSGPLYLASAVNTRTVGIYGPSSANLVAPKSDNHRSVQSIVRCQPCYLPQNPVRGFITCPTGTWACMLTLQSREVEQAVDELLAPKKITAEFSKD